MRSSCIRTRAIIRIYPALAHTVNVAIMRRLFSRPWRGDERTVTEMVKSWVVLAGVAVALASMTTYALTEKQQAALEERIKPAGQVCLEGDSSCGAATAAAASGPRTGKEVFDAACMACHTTGAGGSPVVGDTAAWAPRIAKGIDALYESGINGIPGTGMIAKGGCFNCSDEEIKASVDYMVEQSQ